MVQNQKEFVEQKHWSWYFSVAASEKIALAVKGLIHTQLSPNKFLIIYIPVKPFDDMQSDSRKIAKIEVKETYNSKEDVKVASVLITIFDKNAMNDATSLALLDVRNKLATKNVQLEIID